jgi:hypothetical protein
MPIRRLLPGGLWFKASPGKESKGPHVKKKKNIKLKASWNGSRCRL